MEFNFANELLPVNCRCGGTASVVRVSSSKEEMGEDSLFFVACSQCNISTDYVQDRDEAVINWNNIMSEKEATVNRDAIQNEWKCNNCNHIVFENEKYCSNCGNKLIWKL